MQARHGHPFPRLLIAARLRWWRHEGSKRAERADQTDGRLSHRRSPGRRPGRRPGRAKARYLLYDVGGAAAARWHDHLGGGPRCLNRRALLQVATFLANVSRKKKQGKNNGKKEKERYFGPLVLPRWPLKSMKLKCAFGLSDQNQLFTADFMLRRFNCDTLHAFRTQCVRFIPAGYFGGLSSPLFSAVTL